MKKLSELATIVGGQIIQRVVADEIKGDIVEDKERKTIVAKTISEGCIDYENVVVNNYKCIFDEKKLTHEGDIIIKLSAPYHASLIEKNSEGMLVSSFCAIIRNIKDVDKKYLVAFLNSDICQKQLIASVSGTMMSILSNGKIANIDIVIPELSKQVEIGEYFEKTIKNRILLKKIIKLEEEKLSSIIASLED